MATNFLYGAGTNGYLTTYSLQTTELNTLTSTSVALSSVNGTSGKFSQTNTLGGVWGKVWFKAGGAFTPTGSPYLAGWWVFSTDGGTTFEKASVVLPRPADFIIPLTAAAYATSDIVYASGRIIIPSETHKVLIQNSAAVSLPASGNIITAAPFTIQY